VAATVDIAGNEQAMPVASDIVVERIRDCNLDLLTCMEAQCGAEERCRVTVCRGGTTGHEGVRSGRRAQLDLSTCRTGIYEPRQGQGSRELRLAGSRVPDGDEAGDGSRDAPGDDLSAIGHCLLLQGAEGH
jgi:hypothetical protein